MDIGSISAAMSSLKVAGEITSALLKLKTDSEIQSKAIELNEKLIHAQQELFAAYSEQSRLLTRIEELEKEIAKIDDWEELKKRYKLITPFEKRAVTVYAVKESFSDLETAHWICPKCYDDHRRSILQPQKDKRQDINLVCATCNANINTGYLRLESPKYVPD